MIKMMKKRLNKKGFTLVELIAVLAIIAIIGAIGVPSYNKIVENQKVKADKATATLIGKALELWYIENNATLTAEVAMAEVTADPSSATTKSVANFTWDMYDGKPPVPSQKSSDTTTWWVTVNAEGKATVKLGSTTAAVGGNLYPGN